MKAFLNPHTASLADSYEPLQAPLALHRILPGYAPTPLKNAPMVAQRLGVARVSVKDESYRFGMPAFKILGASYAVYRAIGARLPKPPAVWESLVAWKEALTPLLPLTLATATDGNHGRAVARMAQLLGLNARIFIPQGAAPARIGAIESEGATVVLVDGSYDDAVQQASLEANEHCLVISDTAWEGYTEVPQWVIEGYSTMLNEVDATLEAQHLRPPTVVAVQIGVGALAAAVVRHYRQKGQPVHPKIIGVEPTDAACVLESVIAGQLRSLQGVQHSIMAGLNCGTPSPIAWNAMLTGIDLYLAIDDKWACEAMRGLAKDGIVSGESGAAGLAGLLALQEAEEFETIRNTFSLASTDHVLIISTEGATDPTSYQQIVEGDLGVTTQL
jgi:diaminopropionate ammonia-lyase